MLELYDNAASHAATTVWDDLRRSAGVEFTHLHGAAATARIVADMVDGTSPPLDAAPFRAGRL